MVVSRYKPAIGGIETHVDKVVERLINQGHDVTILTSSHKQGLPGFEHKGQERIIRIPYGWEKNPLLVYTWLLSHRRKMVGYHLVHMHGTEQILMWYLPLILFNVKTPRFATFHGYERDPIPFVFKFLRRIANRFVKGSICIGKFIPTLYGIRCDEVSHGAVDEHAIRTELREEIAYVGRLERDNGILHYLKAMKILKENHRCPVRLHICGEGSLEEEVRNTAESYEIDIKMHGVLSDPIEVIARSSVCFAAGYLSILESLSVGTPVVGISKTSLRQEYLKSIKTEGAPISIQTTSEGVAIESAKLLRNPTYAKQLSKRGHEFASEMTWDSVVNLYRSIWSKSGQ